MSNTQPIGIFDSGIGGTSIWKEIHQLLPHENTLYLADSKNAPYGQKSKKEIVSLSIKNTEVLLSQNCKMIVVACNTATTNAIKELRAKFDIPFIGIEPAIKPAATLTETQTIGILATKGTLTSELFYRTVETYSNVKIIEQIGFGLVQLIEEGKMESEEMTKLLRSYIEPMVQANIDYLVLGCTHYPYLIPQIKKMIPNHIKIIDSGKAVAKQTKQILEKRHLLNHSGSKGTCLFYTNGNPAVLQSILGFSENVFQKDF